jgi:hypothetical protein
VAGCAGGETRANTTKPLGQWRALPWEQISPRLLATYKHPAFTYRLQYEKTANIVTTGTRVGCHTNRSSLGVI